MIKKTKKIKEILIISTITVLIFSLLSTLYLMILWGQLPVEKLTFYPPSHSQNKIILEEESLVDLKELQVFYQFSAETLHFNEWLIDKIEDNEIRKIENNLAILQKSISIGPLLPNSCDRTYCYQYRIPFDNIPAIFWKGLIGIEDNRFLNHFGVDLRSIIRAIITDVIDLKLTQGASTLTQQLIKNLFLTNKKTISRKLKEIILSIYIETKLEKEQILEAYFNEVFWGSIRGVRIKGLYAASLFYFNKKPDAITPYEAAILVALLKGPNYYNPIRHLDRLIDRTNIVYKRLISLALFPNNENSLWNNSNWQSWHKNLIELSKTRYPYVMALVSKEKKIDKKNETVLNQYEKFIFHNGALSILNKIKTKYDKKDFAIKAIIGNPQDKNINNLFTFYSKIERNKFNALNLEYHQLGSSFKPILYGIFKQLGLSMQDYVETAPITLNLLSGDWTPKEAHNPEQTTITLAHALQKSYNRPLIRISRDLKFKTIEKKLINIIPRLKIPLKEYPAQLLGAMELSLFELYNLYVTFINSECRNESSIDENENILYLLSDPNKTTIKYAVDKFLKNLQFFGKTGTSNNGHDNWYIFNDGPLLGVIWVGLEGVRSDENIRIYGSTTAFKIFQHFARNRGKRFNELTCEPNDYNLEQE